MNALPFRCLRSQQAMTRTEVVCASIVFGVLGFVAYGLFRPTCRIPHEMMRAEMAIYTTVQAAKAYENDYKHLPLVGTSENSAERLLIVGDPKSGATQSNAALYDTLRAIDRGVNARHRLNPRQSRYFEDRKAICPESPRGGFAD